LSLPHKLDKPPELLLGGERKQSDVLRSTTVDDKFRALQQYRHARGLCDRCAEKWSYGHKCTATVQLHAIQEMWELMSDEEAADREELLL
jgi:hypothetical protein